MNKEPNYPNLGHFAIAILILTVIVFLIPEERESITVNPISKIKWESRKLMDTNGTETIDWSGRIKEYAH